MTRKWYPGISYWSHGIDVSVLMDLVISPVIINGLDLSHIRTISINHHGKDILHWTYVIPLYADIPGEE